MKIPEKRLIEIRKLIQKEGIISVQQLSEILNASTTTIRRDLLRLDKEGFVNKVHGGAMYREIIKPEPNFNEVKNLNQEKKAKIAKEASKRINDGETIMIESGSTCLELVKYLIIKKDLKVVTDGIFTTNELCKLLNKKRDIEVLVCGGEIKLEHGTYSGPQAISFFNQINIRKAFIGAAAVSVDKGISTSIQFIYDLIKVIRRNSKELILLCDSSKFETYSFINMLPLSEIDEIITDDNINPEIVKKIKKVPIKITLV